jgi:hypothetical protein
MTITGNTLSQTISLTIDGQGIGITLSGTYVDHGYFITFTNSSTGFSNDIIIVEKGNKLITEVNGNPGGGDFSETDQWARVSSSVSALEASASVQIYTPSTGSLAGSLAGELARDIGSKKIWSR